MNQSPLKKILTVLLVLVLFVGIFCAGYYARGWEEKKQQEQAAKVATTFIKDIIGGKTTEAYSLTSKSLQSKQSSADFTKTVKELKANNVTYEEAQYSQKGNQYFYQQKALGLPATSSGNTTGTFFVILERQGSGWKVTNVNVN